MITNTPNDNIRFVTGVILANGVPDDQDDVFTKQDIKKMFIKYLQHDTDTMHNYIRNEGVDLVANWITEIDREIKGKIAPEGSWMATFKVSNSELNKFLDDGTIGGFSLGSMPKELMTQKFWFLDQPIQDVHSFRDLPSIDDANPVFISFVKKGSNGYGLEIEKPNVYINKSSREDNKMPEQNTTDIQEETISLSGLAKLKEIFGINKTATESTEPKTEVKVETKPTEPVETKTESNDISNTELLEKIPTAVATGITEAFTEMAKKEAENTAKPTEPVKTEEEETEENNNNETSSEPTKKIPKINKSATNKEENSPVPNVNTNFYSKSGRDMFGCRIRNK